MGLQVSRGARFLRFGMHAHPYAPAYALVTLLVTQNALPIQNEAVQLTAVSCLYAIPAIVFVGCKHAIDRHFEGKAREAALMTGMACVAFGCACAGVMFAMLAAGFLKAWTALFVFAATQIFVGFGLACIDGADRDLLLFDARRRCPGVASGDDSEGRLKTADLRIRTQGLAAAAFVGALIFAIMLFTGPIFVPFSQRFHPQGSVAYAGAAVFSATAILQMLLMACLRRLAKAVPELREPRTVNGAGSLHAIRNDPHFRTLVPLQGIVDGWLIFLGIILSASALNELVKIYEPVWSLPVALVAAVFIGATSASQIIGNWLEQRWLRPASSKDPGAHVPGAAAVIALGVTALTAYLVFCSATTNAGLDPRVMLLAKSAIFVAALILRGFAQARLFSAIDARIKQIECPYTLGVRGWGSLGARLVQFATTAVAISVAYFLSVAAPTAPAAAGAKNVSSIFKHTLTVGATSVLACIVLVGITLYGGQARKGTLAFLRVVLVRPRPFGRDRLVIHLCFASCIIAANMLTAHANVGAFTFIWGAIPYALAFIFVDAGVERHGRDEWKRLLLTGLVVNLFGALLVAQYAPGSGHARNSFLASAVSFVVAVGVEGEMFATLRDLCRGRCLWARVMITGFVAQALDSLIFVPAVTWLETGSLSFNLTLAAWMHGQMLVKWMVCIVFFGVVYCWKTPYQIDNQSDSPFVARVARSASTA